MFTPPASRESGMHSSTLNGYLLAAGSVIATTLLLLPLRGLLTTLDIALIFLVSVVITSLFAPMWPSTMAGLIAFVCFNFFYIPPYYTFNIGSESHVLSLFVFLGLAVLISQLVVRVRMRTMEAVRRGKQTETLYNLSHALIGEATLQDTLKAIAESVRQVFELSTCAILLDQNGTLVERAVVGRDINLKDRNLLTMAQWAVTHRQAAGLDYEAARIRRPRLSRSQSVPASNQSSNKGHVLFLPIATTSQSLGVLLARREHTSRPFDSEQAHLLETFANQAAIAIERHLLIDAQMSARIVARSDELKSALLSAVSHDLRTPLASIKASATSLLQPGIDWSEADRNDLLTAIDEEVERMNQLITNLLDLSRIEAGALRLDLAVYDPDELVQAAVERAGTLLTHHKLVVDVPADLPPVEADFVKIVQVLVNLLQNAAKYSPVGSSISVHGREDAHTLQIGVADEGIGIDPDHLERIFDKFYRVEDPTRPLGAGIGLAICKGYISAHNGRIWAERRADVGSSLCFTLPLAKNAADVPVPG